MKLLLVFLVSFNCFANSLSYFENGKKISKVKSIPVGKVKEEEIKLYNILSKKEHTYIGVNFYNLMEHHFGKNWKSAKKFTFLAKDGYASAINIKKMLEHAKDRVPYLVYKEKGHEGLVAFKRKKKSIKPGPYFLVWKGFTDKVSKKTLKYIKWPYMLKRIGIIR